MRIETDRLILRPWENRDRAPLAAILGDPEARRYYMRTLTPEETSAEIDKGLALAAENGFHFGAAELKTSGELVGWIGIGVIPELTRDTIPGRPDVEIGWQLARAFWGQGLAPEGARAWLDHAWAIGLPEVVAFTARINLPSQRVMQKIGMLRDHASDYEHPSVPEGHILRPHVLYRIANPGLRP